MRASSVVKRQSTRIASRFRCSCHAPVSGFPRQVFLAGYPAVKALPGQHPQFYLRYIQPTPVLRRVVNLQPFGDAPRLGRLEGLVQGREAVGVQIVHHQDYPVFVRVVHVHQLLHHAGPINLGSLVRHLHPSPPLQGREQHEQVAHPVALVFVIVGHGCPGPRREGLPGLPHLLLAGLVQAHQYLVVLELTVIHLQHVLHGTDELGIGLGRDAPTLLQPRLEFVFFRVRRTVSGLMLWTNRNRHAITGSGR